MRKLLIALAFGVLTLPGQVLSLGMGEIQVYSALNQELNAEIKLLSASPEDAETLIVKLASREEFTRAGLDRPYFLNGLKFSAISKNDTPYIKVTTSKPVREPFLNFLVEIDWPQGHMIREYTILLDPPVFMGNQPDRGPANRPGSRPSGASFDQSTTTHTTATAGGQFRPSVTTGQSQSVASDFQDSTQSGQVATEDYSRPGSIQQDTAAPANFADSTESRFDEPAYQPDPQPEQQVSQFQAQQSSPVSVSNNQAVAYSPPGGDYRIQRGDTLWSLADSMRPDQSISIHQMMLALLRSNPEAFIKENINGLKRGYILRIPDEVEITSVSHSMAVAQVKDQHALWKEYKQELAGSQPVIAPEEDVVAESEPEQVETPATVTNEPTSNETGDSSTGGRLSIVSAGEGEGASLDDDKDPTEMSDDELRSELAKTAEKLESERVEKESLAGEVNDLASQVDKMKRLFSFENEDLAEQQAKGIPVEEGADETEQLGEVTSLDESVVTEEADTTDQETTEEPVEDATAQGGDITESAESEAEGEQPLAETTETTPESDEPVTTTEAVSQEDIFRPKKQQDPLMALVFSPVGALVIGAIVLLLGFIGYMLFKRRKSGTAEEQAIATAFETDLENVADMIEDDSLGAEVSDEQVEQSMLEAEAASEQVEESFDSEATMILPASDSVPDLPSASTSDASASSDDDELRDDVTAEADVYLAYGIYQQAEELLQNAIKENPERDEYRLKLAETHFAGKNADGLANVAAELYSRTGGGENKIWLKVVAMGKELCPDNDLFKGGVAPAVDLDELMPKSPEPMDLDLGGESGDAAATDFDLSFDEPSDGDSGGDLSFDLDETSVIETPSAGAEEEFSLDFNSDETAVISEDTGNGDDEFSLDLDAGDDSSSEMTETVITSATPDDDEFSLDLDAGMDSDSSGDEEISLDMDMGGDDEISLDLDSTMVTETASDSDDEFSLDLDAGDDDEISLDLSAGSDDDEISLDLGGADEEEISLDLDAGGDDDFDLSALDDVDEVSTKLDLARAYLDMGDQEGTRSILEEVVAEGNDAQKKEAEQLLSEIA